MGTVQHGAHSPKLECQISLDDWLCDGELDRIAREREKLNGNVKHESPRCHVEARLALIPEAIRLADAEVSIADNVGLWSRVYKRHLIRLSDEAIEDTSTHHDNGANNGDGAQNCEMNAGPVFS